MGAADPKTRFLHATCPASGINKPATAPPRDPSRRPRRLRPQPSEVPRSRRLRGADKSRRPPCASERREKLPRPAATARLQAPCGLVREPRPRAPTRATFAPRRHPPPGTREPDQDRPTRPHPQQPRRRQAGPAEPSAHGQRRLTSGAAASGVGSFRSLSARPASVVAAAHQPPAAEGR